MATAKFKLNSFDEMFAKTDKTEEEIITTETTENETAMASPKKQEAVTERNRRSEGAFSRSENREPKLPLSCLRKSAMNPFKPYIGDKLNELVESIKEHGILTPILVRPLPDELDSYEIIAGHNRVNAAKIAGLENIPSIIRAMDDDTAAILMVESNFQQRQEISPSEKAFAYKMQLEALKRQGKRTDLTDEGTSAQVERRLESAEQMAMSSDDSRAQIRRFIRLTELNPDILQAVDDNKIPFIPAVNISYLRDTEQQALNDILTEKKIKLSLAKSEKLKSESAGRTLDRNDILDILEEEKVKSTTIKHIKIPFSGIADCFKGSNLSEKDIVRIVTIIVKQHYRDIEKIKKEGDDGILSEQETLGSEEAIG